MQTERLLLRRWEDSDAEALFKCLLINPLRIV